MIQSPQSFIVAEECRKAAWQNGYRRPLGEQDGWAHFESTTAKGLIALAGESGNGPWYLAVDHPGVVEELELPSIAMSGPGTARYAFVTLAELYALLSKVYALALSLPNGPLEAFITAVKDLPRTTEAERLVVQRLGQDIFRDRLMTYWGRKCPLTGIDNPELLRASHIKPWAKCDDDAERLDVHNGLLLSALWDAAFDCGLVSFNDDGTPIFSPRLSISARHELRYGGPIKLAGRHYVQLAWHREYLFLKSSMQNEIHPTGD